jgi:hypothetical protein
LSVLTDTPSPLTKAAQHLTAIADLATYLAAELPHRANARAMPGGDVLAALAPVANLEAHAWQLDAAEAAALDREQPWPDYSHEHGAPTPLQRLTAWTEPLRARLGVETLRPTYDTETALLRRHLPALAQHPAFPRLLGDLHTIRVQLENLTHHGERATRSEVPCWDEACPRQPRLVRVWGDDPDHDGYRCPACHRTYDPDQYARALWQTFGSHTTQRWVTLTDAYGLLPQPQRTTRSWVQRGWVTTTCDRHTRRTLLWWPDLWALWLNPPRRGRPPTVA